QARTIKGKVTDSSNAPLSNVSVQVKGTNTGTTTDLNGSFTLSVPSSASVLVFTFTGMQREEVTVGEQGSINVQLKAATGTLNEVVVIGYGTVRKSDLTGAVATVKGDQLMDRPAAQRLQALQG